MVFVKFFWQKETMSKRGIPKTGNYLVEAMADGWTEHKTQNQAANAKSKNS